MQGWPKGPVKQLRAKFVVFVDEVLSGLDLDDCSATGSFMPIPGELLLVHSRGKDFEFFQKNAFLGMLGNKPPASVCVLYEGEESREYEIPQECSPMARSKQFRQDLLHPERLEEAQDGIYADHSDYWHTGSSKDLLPRDLV